MKRILFYDRHSSGHHMEYFRHLIRFSEKSVDCKVFFALPKDAVSAFKKEEDGNVSLVEVPIPEARLQLQQTIIEGKWIAQKVRDLEITDLFFLNLDPYQFIVNTRAFKSLKCQVHGILFSPPHRLYPGGDSSFSEQAKQFLRRNRKQFQLRWALRNKSLKTVFILDDDEGQAKLGHMGQATFARLNDPIDQDVLSEGNSCKYELLPESKVLLAFGSIVPRKNLINIINSLRGVEGHDVTLLIVGKGREDYVRQVKEAASVYDSQMNISVIVDNRFVADEEMEELFSMSDAIVMVYQNFYGSSGVLGRSAKYMKPVLVADQGLVAALTKKYGLGVTVKSDTENITRGMKLLLNHDLPSGYNGADYLRLKTIPIFCETIFNCMVTPSVSV